MHLSPQSKRLEDFPEPCWAGAETLGERAEQRSEGKTIKVSGGGGQWRDKGPPEL